jgi:hypothetical protein
VGDIKSTSLRDSNGDAMAWHMRPGGLCGRRWAAATVARKLDKCDGIICGANVQRLLRITSAYQLSGLLWRRECVTASRVRWRASLGAVNWKAR